MPSLHDLDSDYSLGLQAIKGLVEDIIIPLICGQFIVTIDDGEGIDQGCAQEGVHVLWCVLPITRPVLRPVGEVAHHLAGRSCVEVRGTFKKQSVRLF